VVLDEVVSHGPFPLAQLASFNLIPSMASVKTVLVNNDITKPLFDIAKNTSPFEIDTRIGLCRRHQLKYCAESAELRKR
jgi:uncharacterized protein YdgA (DUF945 family)